MNWANCCMKWVEMQHACIKFESIKFLFLRTVLFNITCLILLLSFSVGAQEPKQYSFTHYSSSSGLLSNQVFATTQDEDGYIWIGGTNGLQRFDGFRYKSFRHIENDSTSLPTNPIQQLLYDKKKRLWVFLFDGTVGLFDTRNFTFSKKNLVAKNQTSFNTPLKRLIQDEVGNVFLLLQGNEVLTWNEKANEFSYKHNFFKQLSEWGLSDFAQQPGTQKYWMGIQGAGLVVYNKATGNLSYAGHNVEHEPVIDALPKDAFPAQMLFDKKGRVWFVYWGGAFPRILCYDTKANKFDEYELLSQVKAYHEISGFTEQRDGTIWVRGTKVFAKFLEKEKKFQLVYDGYINEYSISYEMVYSLFEDRENNLWAGTNNNGLFRFDPAQQYFTNIIHTNRRSGNIGSGSVMSFMYTKWGTLLAGTWEDGLYNLDSNLNNLPVNIKGIDNNGGPFIWNMFAAADSNTIWMSSQPGIYQLNQKTRSVNFYNPPILENRTIRQIVQDKNGDIWLGMQHIGLFKWKIGNKQNIGSIIPEKYTTIPKSTINKIFVDKRGLIWIGTPKNGAYAIDPATDKIVTHIANDSTTTLRLPEEGVSCILEYNDSIMVITTSTRIVTYNRNSHQVVPIGKPGIFAGYIAGLEKDNKNYLWITTTSGLYRLDLKSGLFINFNKEDGILYDNFILNASYALPDGRLAFGNSSQFIIFDPAKVFTTKRYEPKVMITEFEVSNNKLSVDSLLQLKEIHLLYKQNSLNISFSSLTYNAPFLIQYKLEGLDKDWKNADKNAQATFSYLPPRRYTLLFRTIDPNGKITMSDLKLIIEINSPFWKTWWFYSLLALFVGGLLFWFDKERTKRKATLQKMRSDIAGSLHKEISSALNNINVLSEMARIKADIDPAKSKEFIEQIHSKSGNMIYAMDDMLWSISPENDSMGKTIERMQEYIGTLSNRTNTHIEMLVEENIKSLKVDMQFRHEAFLLFKESIKGLLAAGASHCKIHIALDKSNLLYSIQFNNEGCNMQQLYNLLHRQDMAKRLENIKGELDVQVNKTISVFELKVPVG